ncbi:MULTISPECIES: hypothetical protein [unclassified Paenibacillus]|uniref:hypothetical protein n=1 Tax=unclassified Paenibacillus TaxID=185978 RepID=UPI000954435C|nr:MULTISPECIES: hypothetical protein [unclassified Paenibacillus]ASS67828.1 hypothetical protein CIC07_18015 [Paenibacillus sp. RUD330]SIR59855.1 hypothetical protein SAMN05880555_4369 [Paenibacillus sp. RU4X]SIR68662.1 hypothetical protein SAMN05880570_4371 [Paenibacillus sp. RU4T]
MTIFLDSRASQNASYGNSLSIPIAAAGALQLVAQQTLNLSAGTSGLVRVEFSGVVTFQQPTTPADTMVSIYVIRGASAAAGVNVYSLNQAVQAAEVGPRAISLEGSDSGASTSSAATYSVYVTASVAGILRVGPESFNFTGYSG